MERIGVIRNNGIVTNAILWADHTPEQLLADGITDFEEVTGLEPRPGIGWLWDSTHGYRPPKRYSSWSWSDETQQWEAPVPQPGDDYEWNETSQSWHQVVSE